MDIVIHVAVAENGVIGVEGGLPWKLSTDLRRFKEGTMGRPIVMGRKTYDSIGRPLPGRLNIVVTRDQTWRAEGVETVGSLDDAIALARVRGRCMAGVDEVAIIGGGQIYEQAMSLADKLHVTHV
jgi:dihydrofolate reductase